MTTIAPLIHMQVSLPLIWGIRPGCAEIRRSIEALAPGWSSDFFQTGCISLDLNPQGRLCAWPNIHGTQIGQRPFKDARRRDILPNSAKTINCGNGKWCNWVWWLIISSCSSESALGCKMCSNWEGVLTLLSWKLSLVVSGIDAMSQFSMKSMFQCQQEWPSHSTAWSYTWASCPLQSWFQEKSLCLMYLSHRCISTSCFVRKLLCSQVS